MSRSSAMALLNEAPTSLNDEAPPESERSIVPTNINAAAVREAGRLNARAIRYSELESLLDERQQLLDKKFAGTITKREANRLALVRWSLDRIDDARHGPALESMGQFVSQMEQFKKSVDKFRDDLHAATKHT